MNRERIEALARLIEQLEDGRGPGYFSIGAFAWECGSPACVAGWTAWLYGTDGTSRALASRSDLWIVKTAMEALGLTFTQHMDLFYPIAMHRRRGNSSALDVTASGAAAALRHLLQTGEARYPELPFSRLP